MKTKLMKHTLMQKEKGFYSDAGTWENGDSHLKDHLIFLLKPAIFIGIGRGGLSFLSNYFSRFLHAGALSICLSRPWLTQCKYLPLHHLSQWGRLPGAL